MTYEPYPTAPGGNQTGGSQLTAQRPPQPSTVRNAVLLMWVGAGLALLGTITTLAFSGKIRSAVTKAALKANRTRASRGKVPLTAAQIHTLGNVTVVVLAVVLIVGVLLWMWMARANSRGSNWARMVATVLFTLNTLSLVLSLGRASLTIIFVALGWLVGLVAVVLLWLRPTTEYINSRVQ
jgi:hypothetical protein